MILESIEGQIFGNLIFFLRQDIFYKWFWKLRIFIKSNYSFFEGRIFLENDNIWNFLAAQHILDVYRCFLPPTVPSPLSILDT